MPKLFEQKQVTLDIVDYRSMLPCDFLNEIQVRDSRSKAIMRKTASSFDITQDKSIDIQYKIQGNIIFSSIKEHQIDLSYTLIPTDDEGYPLLLDNAKFIRALESYIKLKWFTILFDLGKITQQAYQNAKSDYSFHVGQAQTDLIRPTVDQMEAISNMWNKLLPDSTMDHEHGYVHEGTKEHIINH